MQSMVTALVLSPQVALPRNTVTATVAILGTRGSGKTHGAGVIAEELLERGDQLVVLDPVGIWWALRLHVDGVSRGYNIAVLGGLHGDAPLTPEAGALVARLVAVDKLSCVLDVSDFTEGQQRRFVADFARELFQLKKANRSPLHLMVEEAHEFLPQDIDGGTREMLGHMKRLWKVGRNFGIGGTLITQRAAEINKSALNLSDVVITGRLTAPEDTKRIAGWAGANGLSRDAILELPKLPKGTLIVWREGDGAIVTRFRAKRTFDASKTPEVTDDPGARPLPPIDVELLRRTMTKVQEEVLANDPTELRRQIAALQASETKPAILRENTELRVKLEGTIAEADALRERVTEYESVMRPELVRLQAIERKWNQVARIVGNSWGDGPVAHFGGRVEVVKGVPDEIIQHADVLSLHRDPAGKTKLAKLALSTPYGKFGKAAPGAPPPTPARTPPARDPEEGRPVPRSEEAEDETGDLDGGKRMLLALRAVHPMPLTTSELAVRAVMRAGGGSFVRQLKKLKDEGKVQAVRGLHNLTPAGQFHPIEATLSFDPDDLLAAWSRKFKGGAVRILTLLSRSEPMSSTEIGRLVGMNPKMGAFSRYMAALRRARLIERAPRRRFRITSALSLVRSPGGESP